MDVDWVIRTIECTVPVAFSESNIVFFLCFHCVVLSGFFGWRITKIF